MGVAMVVLGEGAHWWSISAGVAGFGMALLSERPLRGRLILEYWRDFPTLSAPLPVARMQL
jgi:hypothetical protein